MRTVARHGGARPLRKQVEAQVELLIALLDDLDGNLDIEEEEDDQCDDEGAFNGDNDASDLEPSLCGITMQQNISAAAYAGGCLEHDLELEE